MNDLRTILLAEDNEDDVFAMKRALKGAGVVNPLQIVDDGQQTLDYLSGQGAYADRTRFPLPFILFLDLKLPYVHGFEILEWLSQQRTFESLPIVILSSSDETRDHERAYSLGARSYLVKPPRPDDLKAVFESLQNYWLLRTGAFPVAFKDATANKS